MNWYILAQENLISSSSLPDGSCWIDPYGAIYPLKHGWGDTHESWIKDNIDFLEEEYSINFIQGDLNNLMKCQLMDKGWIRVLTASAFEVGSVVDKRVLYKIKDLLEEKYFPDDTIVIKISSLGLHNIYFSWKDYKESGQDFAEYIVGCVR